MRQAIEHDHTVRYDHQWGRYLGNLAVAERVRGAVSLAEEADWQAQACWLNGHSRPHRTPSTDARFTDLTGAALTNDRANHATLLAALARGLRRWTNPILCARLADVRWEAGRDHRDAQLAIDAYLAAAEIHLAHGREYGVADALDRAAELAGLLGDTPRLHQVKARAFRATRELVFADADHPPVGSVGDLLQTIHSLRRRPGLSPLDQRRLLALTERCVRRCEQAGNFLGTEYFLKLLMAFAQARNDEPAARTARRRLAMHCADAGERAAVGDPLAGLPWLLQAVHLAANVGDRALFERLKRRLAELSVTAQRSAEGRPLALPPAMRQHLGNTIARLAALPGLDGLRALALGRHALPDVAALLATIEGWRARGALSLLFPQLFLGGARITGAPGDGTDAGEDGAPLDGHALFHYVVERDVLGLIVEGLLDHLEEEGRLTAQSLGAFLGRSRLLEGDPDLDGTTEIVARGLERYFAEDYLAATHLLVPRLEAVIRNLLHHLGRSTQAAQRGTTHALTLGQVLLDPDLRTLLGEDVTSFLAVLLTDQRADNLRNTIAHGLARPHECDRAAARRVLHAYILLVPFAGG